MKFQLISSHPQKKKKKRKPAHNQPPPTRAPLCNHKPGQVPLTTHFSGAAAAAAAVGKLGWSGRCPACGARGRLRRGGGGGAPRRGEVSYLRRGLGARGPGLGTRRRGTGAFQNGTLLAPPPPTPHSPPGARLGLRGKEGAKPACQPASQTEAPVRRTVAKIF